MQGNLGLTLRTAIKEDLPQIMEINNQYAYCWTLDKFYDTFEYELPFTILELDHKIIGYLVYAVILDEARILNLTIDKFFQGQGHGKYLLEYSLQEIKNKGIRWALLDVSVNNTIAINLYTKFGYQILCRRRNYYEEYDGADAYFMQLELY